MRERRGACGCLDLYCNVDLDLHRNLYANKSVSIVVQKSIHSFHEVKHSTAYLFRVNIDGCKSQWVYFKVIAHKEPTKK